MKNYLILVIKVFCIDVLIAQNLISNGGFEEHLTFKMEAFNATESFKFLKDWENNSLSSPAYCHKSIVRDFGYQIFKMRSYSKFDTTKVFNGDAMIKLFYEENCPLLDTGCTCYLKTKLISPLELGEVYEISMWIYTDINPAADTSMNRRIGIYLTKYDLPKSSHDNMISTDYFFYGKAIPGMWTQLKWYIRALCPLQYVTVGVFRDSSFRSLYRQIYNPVYYYVDDVFVKRVNEDSLSADIHPTPYCEYYEREYKQQVLSSITSLDLRFESNSSTLDANDQLELDSFYNANLERKDKIFIIIGHTDSQTAENILLSQARAESVSDYLNNKYSVNKKSMLTFGLGSNYPIGDNTTSSGRLQNRRVTIRTSDLTIPQLFYRKGLDYIETDSLGKASIQFTRWIKMVPMAKRVEMLVDPRLLKLKRSVYWKPLVADVRKGYSLYPDSKSAFYLDSLYFEDQKYRTYSPYSLNGYIEEIDTAVLPEFKFTEQQFNQKDSLNFLAVQKFLDSKGYPEISKVGRRQSRAIGFIILHHFDSLTFERYIPVVKDRCMAGEAEWDIFAMMTDKLCISRGEPQVYGTQYDKDSNGRIILYTIDNIEKVNYRRMRIGLGKTVMPE